jgi:bacterial/archaeal transporter family-2 protein
MPRVDKGLAVLITAIVGGLIALQPAINAGLGRATGSMPAALVSFAVGTLALAAIVVLAGQASGVTNAFSVEPVYLLGGLLGAVYVTTALIMVKTIGAGGVAAGTITGQLTFSLVIDRAGWFGLQQTPVTLSRLAGVGLLLLGTWLVVR